MRDHSENLPFLL